MRLGFILVIAFKKGDHVVMNIRISTEKMSELVSDCLIVVIYEGQTSTNGFINEVDKALNGRISQLIAEGEIKGKFGEVSLLHNWGQIPAKRTPCSWPW